MNNKKGKTVKQHFQQLTFTCGKLVESTIHQVYLPIST